MQYDGISLHNRLKRTDKEQQNYNQKDITMNETLEFILVSIVIPCIIAGILTPYVMKWWNKYVVKWWDSKFGRKEQ